MKKPSASSCESLVMCPASHALPQSQIASVQAKSGVDHHAVMERLAGDIKARAKTGNTTAPDKMVWQHKLLFNVLNEVLDGCDPTTLETEIAFAVDVEKLTVRRIPGVKNRNYGTLGKYEIPATLDLIVKRNDGSWRVRDWKFGSYSTKYQVIIQAMAIAFWANQPTVDAGTVHIAIADHTYEEVTEDLEMIDLELHAGKLKAAIDKAEALAEALKLDAFAIPETHMGQWCKYCGALAYCPARNSLMANMLPEIRAMVASTTGEIDAKSCGKIWERMREIERACELVRESLMARLESLEAFPLPNGKTLRIMTQKGYMVFDREPTYQLLKRLGATEEDIASAKKRLSERKQAREFNK